MKRTGIILLLAILSGACHPGNGDFSNKDQIIQSFPVLIDSTGSDGLNLSKETENTTWLTTAQ
ncbi:hypothetical protein [Algoriphagus sp. NG3]|uniref:hypothetical protein n=1 Tax=Algoriphagus sp. NG3 TaxID=3097546 RepID=UPI002A7EB741|nr:hypothetical protein [Algoriphagus sp. NG3]WPR77736.1 hypothetical protein SLW71_10310 [Algoriphagus sp. NG3]